MSTKNGLGPSQSPQFTKRVRYIRAAAVLTVALGVVVLVGWAGDIPSFRSVFQGAVQMKANTAVGLVLAGVALFILCDQPAPPRRHLADALSLGVAAIGFGTMSEYAFGWNLGIDEFLFNDNAVAYNLIRGRMAPASAMAFCAIGTAMTVLHRPKLQPIVWLLAASVTVIGAVSFLGYLWNVAELVTDRMLPPVAVNTALGFMLLGTGTLLSSRKPGSPHDSDALTRSSIEVKMLGGFIGAFLLMLAGGGYTYRSGAEFTDTVKSIAHIQKVRAALQHTYAAVSDAESAQRNYMISRERDFKEDFLQWSQKARDEARNLVALDTEYSAQPRLSAQLQTLVDRRLTALKRVTAAFDIEGMAGVQAAIIREAGWDIMRELREVAARMDDAEAALLAKHEAIAVRDRLHTLVSLLLTLAVAIGIFAALVRSIRREMSMRADAEQVLATSERHSRTIINSSPDQLVELSLDGVVFGKTSSVSRRITLADSDQVDATDWCALWQGEDCDAARRAVAEARAGGTGRYQGWASSLDGSPKWWDVIITPILDQDGKPERLLSVSRDITRQHEAEQEIRRLNANLERRDQERSAALDALHQKEEEIRAIVDNLLDCLITIDAQGIVRSANPALAHVLGYTTEEVIGRNVSVLMPYPNDLGHDVFLRNFVRTGEACTIGVGGEVEGRHRSGQLIPLELGVSEYMVRGERYFIGILRDIRERKQFIAELTKAREDAEQANRAKSAFLATMSHEIRTPMNGVIGMVEVLAHSKLPDHLAEAVKTIRDSAFSLLSIIDEILDFSKIEAGRMELERAQVCVDDLVEGICVTLVPVAAAKGVDLNLFIAPDVPELVWGDATRLRQVLFNLVGNAIKFSGGRHQQRGRVMVRAEITHASPPQLIIAITDNGIGMAPQTLASLFTPFNQAEASTTRRFGGTGLGLVICRRLVDLMHGTITVESTPGAGSTFTIALPVEPVHAATGRTYVTLDNVDCIVVAGQALNAKDLRIYLEHAGAHVQVVADLNAAVWQAAQLTMPVVLQGMESNDVSVDALHKAFAGAPNARHLLIGGGKGQSARIEAADVVTLNCGALRRRVLLRAVAVAAGLASPEIFHASDGDDLSAYETVQLTVAEARAQGQLILIAEDDETNQKVILRQLGLLGYAAEVAGNGVEALRLWREGHYAMLLTDLHMPEMDGYTLCETIRTEEAGKPRMPILALTANALQGEANRALAAGMDEYLTKPMQLHQLRTTLERWLPHAVGAAPAALPPVVDVAVLKNVVGDDEEAVREFLSDYLTSMQRQATELRAACGAEDVLRISAITHKLKSSSRAVGALALGDLCATLENAGKADDKAVIAQGMAQFEQILEQVEARIAEILAQQCPDASNAACRDQAS